MTIRLKLYLLGIVAITGLGILFSINAVGSYRLKQFGNAADSSVAAKVEMLQARRAEKDFLARKDAKYVTGNSESITRSIREVELVRESLPELSGQVSRAVTLLGDYERQFKSAASGVTEMGLDEKSGLRGKLRNAIHGAEEVIKKAEDDTLLAGMLMLRRREKDFIIRGDIKYLQKYNEDMARLESAVVAASSLDDEQRRTIEELLGIYKESFHEYVAKAVSIKENIKAFTQTAHELEPLLNEMADSAQGMYEKVSGDVAKLLTGSAAGTAVLLLVILVSVIRSILRPLQQLQNCSLEVSAGNYEACMKLEFSGELEELRRDISQMVENMKESMQAAEIESENAQKQTLAAESAMQQANEEKERSSQLVEQMKEVAEKATTISARLSDAANELSAQADEILQGTRTQLERTASASTAMEEMNATVLDVANNAASTSSSTEDVRRRAEQGARLVSDVATATDEVEKRTLFMKKSLADLGQKTDAIGNIMNVITDIADQTNLLALNAAIEAARAGEAGRGFAVVADEVRKLAEKTVDATSEVGDAIRGIQEGTKGNIEAIESAGDAVAKSSGLAREAGIELDEIVAVIKSASDQVRSIATAVEEQSATGEEINRASDEINSISMETARSMEKVNEATTIIAQLAEELQELIKKLNA